VIPGLLSWPATLQALCLSCEPKARVATVFYLILGLPKDCHQEKIHPTLSYLLYVTIFWPKVANFQCKRRQMIYPLLYFMLDTKFCYGRGLCLPKM
jgi:hypothetical protein